MGEETLVAEVSSQKGTPKKSPDKYVLPCDKRTYDKVVDLSKILGWTLKDTTNHGVYLGLEQLECKPIVQEAYRYREECSKRDSI